MHADCASHNGALFLAPLVCHMLYFQEHNTTLPPSNTLHLILTPLTKIMKETLTFHWSIFTGPVTYLYNVSPTYSERALVL